MEELELYINNTIKNEEELKSYNCIIVVLKKLLSKYKIEMGGLDRDSSGNITKKSNGIDIFIEKYDKSTPNQFAQVVINNEKNKTIVFRVNANILNSQGFNYETNYQNSPIKFYVDMSDKEKGTVSLEANRLYYYDKDAYDNYVEKTQDDNPSHSDYKKEGIMEVNTFNIGRFKTSEMIKNMQTFLSYGLNAPLAEEVSNIEKINTKTR